MDEQNVSRLGEKYGSTAGPITPKGVRSRHSVREHPGEVEDTGPTEPAVASGRREHQPRVPGKISVFFR